MLVEIMPHGHRDGKPLFFACYINSRHLADRVTRAECWEAVDDLIKQYPELPQYISKSYTF